MQKNQNSIHTLASKRRLRATFRKYVFSYTFEVVDSVPPSHERLDTHNPNPRIKALPPTLRA